MCDLLQISAAGTKTKMCLVDKPESPYTVTTDAGWLTDDGEYQFTPCAS